jgi:hypothetical protein
LSLKKAADVHDRTTRKCDGRLAASAWLQIPGLRSGWSCDRADGSENIRKSRTGCNASACSFVNPKAAIGDIYKRNGSGCENQGKIAGLVPRKDGNGSFAVTSAAISGWQNSCSRSCNALCVNDSTAGKYE